MIKKLRLLFLFFVLLFIMYPFSTADAVADEWIQLPALKEIPISKQFNVTFNREITNSDIEGIVIIYKGNFIPVKIDIKGKDAIVTPVEQLLPMSFYEMRIFIANKKYRLDIETSSANEVGNLLYKGKTDVRSLFAKDQLVKNINHYVADLGIGHPINLYVTDDYEQQYGKGFAYEETISAMKSIDMYRKAKPYTTEEGTLDIFFYTNNSNTPLPDNDQAAINHRTSNTGSGAPSEIIVNGSKMPYDFRTSYIHELIHYFDYQSFINEQETMNTYEKYWGPNYRFWLLEGGAEYGGYFFYDYPTNTKNSLRKELVQPTKESILAYAKAQGGGKRNLLYDIELNSFDDIYKASSNNYGITLSLFWYLSEEYGYDKIYDYAKDISETFKGASVISEQEKESMAKKHFSKTEEQILKDWMVFFNYFEGELQEYKETTIGTANTIFHPGDSLFPFQNKLGLNSTGDYNFAVNIKEWIAEIGDDQARSFIEQSTTRFQLKSNGNETVTVNRDWGFYTGLLANGERLYAFSFNIPAMEMQKLVKGATYTLHPIDNDAKYQWILPESLKFIWQ